ncbi:MAG TPA: iron-containing redox enzyme family protein [Streptosporangiaceae bacterium]|nr:iron-containing redox enzyme family protein [Streptosporangiaceae bacterium]
MTVPTVNPTLTERLEHSPVHQAFIERPFFRGIADFAVSKEQAAVFLGQWWHPLHYFPTFLARCVAVLPDITSKSAVTRILNQETGNGRVAKAHEVIYEDSMVAAGFDRAAITGTAPFPETAELVSGYERASAQRFSALGFIYATEVTDLLMVSSIGKAVERATGQTKNQWVIIHVAQEPDHVAEAGRTMLDGFTPPEQDEVLTAADEMWTLWSGFFDRLSAETGIGLAAR